MHGHASLTESMYSTLRVLSNYWFIIVVKVWDRLQYGYNGVVDVICYKYLEKFI